MDYIAAVSEANAVNPAFIVIIHEISVLPVQRFGGTDMHVHRGVVPSEWFDSPGCALSRASCARAVRAGAEGAYITVTPATEEAEAQYRPFLALAASQAGLAWRIARRMAFKAGGGSWLAELILGHGG